MKATTESSKRKTKSLAQIFAIAILAVGSFGCTSLDRVNAELYDGGNDLDGRYAQLHKGMTKEDFFKVMGSDIDDRWQDIDSHAKMSVKCGCTLTVQSLAELEKASQQVEKLEGYQVTYEDVKKKPDYIGTRKRVDIEGYRVTMRFVFEDGKLAAWDRNGGPVSESKTKPYVDFNGTDIKLPSPF